MKKKEKKGILILIVVAVIIIIALVVMRYVKNNGEAGSASSEGSGTVQTDGEQYTTAYSDGSKMNTSSKLQETKTYGDFTISDIQLTTKDGISTILANVKNNGDQTTEETDITIIFVDEQGNTIASVPAIIQPMSEGSTSQLNASITQDIANAYDFRIE